MFLYSVRPAIKSMVPRAPLSFTMCSAPKQKPEEEVRGMVTSMDLESDGSRFESVLPLCVFG